MAADFLQSNRHSSLFLTEGLLRRIRMKMAKMSDDRFRKLDKESQQAQKDSCDRARSEVQDLNAHQHDNNDDCNSSSSSKIDNKESGTTHDAPDEHSTSNMNVKCDVAMNDTVTRPKLKANLPHGLVWIPKPPNNPRVTHSPNSNSSSTEGRDQTGGSISKSPTRDATMVASTQDDNISVEDQIPESCFQADASQDNPLQNHLALDQRKPKDIPDAFKDEESSTLKNDNEHQQVIEGKISLTQINHTTILTGLNNILIDSFTGYSDDHEQEDNIQGINSEDQDEKLTDDKKDDNNVSVKYNPDTNNEDDDDNVASSTDKENEHNKEIAKEVLPKIQPGYDDASDKDRSSSNCVVNDSFNNQTSQSLKDEGSDHVFVECKEDIGHTQGNMTYEVEVYPQMKPEVMVTNNTTQIVNIVSNQSLSKKNQFLKLMHLLLDMRLKRTDKEGDDTEPLVEREILEDVTRQDDTTMKTEKRRSCRLSLFGRGREIKETTHINPSPTPKEEKKKRRRPRRKVQAKEGGILQGPARKEQNQGETEV